MTPYHTEYAAKILDNILKSTISFWIENCSKNIGKYSTIYDPISLLLPPDWCSTTGPFNTKLYHSALRQIGYGAVMQSQQMKYTRYC